MEQQTLRREVEAYEVRLDAAADALEKIKQASGLNPLAMERVCDGNAPDVQCVDLIVLLERIGSQPAPCCAR